MLRNSRALHQDRLRLRATTGDLRQSLIDFLPRTEERHRQDARLHGPQEARQLHSVRAFHNGGAAHSCNNLITKVDLSDFYMHFPISHSDRRYT